MKKLQSSLKNMLLVLTGVTAVSVALLAVVNDLTKEPIAQAQAKALNDALLVVLPPFDNQPVAECKTDTIRMKDPKDTTKVTLYPCVIYEGMKEGQLVGKAIESSSLGFGGELKVLVGFTPEGKIINYSLLAHTETPGLGDKASFWFKKGGKGNITDSIPGKKGLHVSKDAGGTVDAITASTITSRAFLKAINIAYQAFIGETTVDATSSATQQVTEEPESDAQTAATQQADKQVADSAGTANNRKE
ncbi:MAG: RnfABCDGE type electron transport complex subunit G [Prevotellaceae bacterium]|jgi:electron transport complex protein RnfG|nr:RnfABCDGE type electron transport complex subunit G [Prevotellaceae bacterium]